MSAILEEENIALVGPEMTSVSQFALSQVSGRLASDPALISAFWREIGEPAGRPNLTVVYCAVRRLGLTYALFEFVAGETLEELVKRSDPAACEMEIPLFCRILDAFEGSARLPRGEQSPPPGLELLDFGIARANADLTSKLHGAVMTGLDGFWNDAVFGEYGASRSQVFAALMELRDKIPGDLPRFDTYGPANLGLVSACSLAARPERSEPAAKIETVPVRKPRSLIGKAIPYLIAMATMALVLLTFYGVGGFLAKRTPPDAGKLVLPPMPVEPPETQEEAKIAPQPEAPEPAPPAVNTRHSRTPVESRQLPVRGKRAARQPVASIVVARGAKPIRRTNLEYPAEARKKNVTGVVEMQFTIAADGSVQSPRFVSGDPLLRAGLAEELSHWVYQPLRVDGKPVPMTAELAIRFNLN